MGRSIRRLPVALALAACAVNPATGERQLSLISESQEIAMGREADPAIVASMGLYEDQELQRYVQNLGARLAATSERPGLPWTFRLVDDPVVNAFALPGGFIYITRGIMAHLTSEAQLAAIVGHEIGHVTARHSAEQMSRAQLAQVGLVAGAMLSSGFRNYGFGLASQSLGLLFLKFGRDDERQSDDLGLRYMVRGGYDPRPMPGVFIMLDQVSEVSGGRGVPEWLSTHPNPANRSARLTNAIAAMNEDFSGRRVAADEYLGRLDGMVYGVNPRSGFFRDNLFLHPDLEFQLRFPAGWQTQNQPQAVVGVSRAQDAIIQLSLNEHGSPGEAARAFFEQEGISGQRRSFSVNGLNASGGDFWAETEQAALRGRAVFLSYGGSVYQILGYGSSNAWSDHRNAIDASLGSFARLTDREALSVQPNRIDIITLEGPTTLRQFAQRYGSEGTLDELAIINQVRPDETLPAGRRLKRVAKG